ncbi:hypothetical protein HT136_04385 [Novosphingobium profundi]|uniref:hypothetical protein n=1 Tax=Novosphingobium profundi TaxID=1774954 RepID=UPI001BDA279A|nr:hypothetical protein [Novosphingobium profundi]MBT0667603.1 hypothetical protein [Novosphingobium profundi]
MVMIGMRAAVGARHLHPVDVVDVPKWVSAVPLMSMCGTNGCEIDNDQSPL